MTWRLAKSLEVLRDQVNARWPGRSRDSDGSIGDASHSARTSDHNPDSHGVVRAIDITHDPRSGFDSYAFADMLLKQQDPRLKYVISNHRIGSGPADKQPGMWRKYTGSNPHDHHVHISVVKDARADSTQAWNIDGMAEPDPTAPPHKPPPPTVRRGSHGEYVKLLQSKLGFTGSQIDGDFGPKTESKVKAYQAAHNLVADGICGPQTWKSFNSGE